MSFLEKWNNFLLSEDHALLVEGRKENAMKALLKKIDDEEVEEKLHKVTYNRILQSDPTPDKKYIEWAARRINIYTVNMYEQTHVWNFGQTHPEPTAVDPAGPFAPTGPTLRDVKAIAAKDPTGNELYTAAKQQEVAVEHTNKGVYETLLQNVLRAVGRQVDRLARNLPNYVKLVERNLIEKNIDSFKDLDTFYEEIETSMEDLNRRDAVKAMEKQAKEESDVIANNEDILIVRPYTAISSTCWGKSEVGVTWCISASESRNYFDQYTGEGTGFYFVFMKHLPKSSDNKKICLVYKPGDEYEPSEVYDRPDEAYDSDHVHDVARENVLAGALRKVLEGQLDSIKGPAKNRRREEHYSKEYEVMISRYENLIQADLSVGTVKGRIEGGILEKMFAAMGIDNVEEFEEYIDEAVSELAGDIMGTSGSHWGDNPAGPTEEEYDKILEDAELKHVHVNIEEYDESRLYWSGHASWDFSQEEGLADDVDTDVVRDLLSDVMSDHYAYPDEVEDNSYNNAVECYATFNADHGEHEGLEGFKSFVERMSEVDAAYEKIHNDTVDKMKESGIIHGESFASTKESFEALDLDNYDVDVEEGKIILSSRFVVKLLLPEEIAHDRGAIPGEEQQDIEMAKKAAYNTLINIMGDSTNVENLLLAKIRGRFQQAFTRMYDMIGRQMKLDLKEDNAEISVPVWDMKMGSMGPQKQGTADLGAQSRDYSISDTWVYWFDVVAGSGTKTPEEIFNLHKFIKLVDKDTMHEKMRQHVEGWANRMLQLRMPQIKEAYQNGLRGVQFESLSATAASDPESELQSLFESWRRHTG